MAKSEDVPDITLLYGELKELCNLIINQDVQATRQYIQDKQITSAMYSLLPWYKQTGIYPVEVATEVGNIEILTMLLSLGFSPTGLKTNPIYIACKTGNVPIVKLLMKYGVDVVNVDSKADQPLCSAIEHGQLDVVKTLVEAGASVNLTDAPTSTRVSTTASTTCQYTYPLSHAASIGAGNICKYLVSKGAKMDSTDHKGRTALFQAARHHREAACQILLDAGADVDSRSCSGLTPFLAAVSTFYDSMESSNNRLNVMKLLLSRGANPDSVDMFGCSALHYAIHSYDVTRFLVDKNVTLNTRNDCKNSTPFKMAIVKGSYNVAAILIKAGYNPSGEECIKELEMEAPAGIRILELVRKVTSNPLTLQNICCFKIRSILGRTLCNALLALPLPKTVKDLIMLKHIPLTASSGPVF